MRGVLCEVYTESQGLEGGAGEWQAGIGGQELSGVCAGHHTVVVNDMRAVCSRWTRRSGGNAISDCQPASMCSVQGIHTGMSRRLPHLGIHAGAFTNGMTPQNEHTCKAE